MASGVGFGELNADRVETVVEKRVGDMKGLVLKIFLGMVGVYFVSRCHFRAVLAVEALEKIGDNPGGGLVFSKESWMKVLQVLYCFKEQGLILAGLLGLSAFFSMAETSITTLWPWKVCF